MFTLIGVWVKRWQEFFGYSFKYSTIEYFLPRLLHTSIFSLPHLEYLASTILGYSYLLTGTYPGCCLSGPSTVDIMARVSATVSAYLVMQPTVLNATTASLWLFRHSPCWAAAFLSSSCYFSFLTVSLGCFFLIPPLIYSATFSHFPSALQTCFSMCFAQI